MVYTYRVKNPCCKRCKRKPSMFGLEAMILIPLGSIFFILCGGCTHKLLRLFKKEKVKDLSNLFVGVGNDHYHAIVENFLRFK